GEQDDEFNLDEDDHRQDRHKGRDKARRGKQVGKKAKKEGRWRQQKFKSLHQVLYEVTGTLSSYPGGATAVSIEAPESKLPPRQFCSVCGYLGLYACTRCGSRFCTIRCMDQHKETRCLKFSV
ncbi:unnamed protein product, partial [Choristocarpus tenellus]